MADDSWSDWFKKQDGGRWGAFAAGSVVSTWLASHFFQPGFLTQQGEAPGFLENWFGRPIYFLMNIGIGILGGVAAASFWSKGGDQQVAAAVDSGAKTVGSLSERAWNGAKGLFGFTSHDASVPLQAQVIAAVDRVENPAEKFRQLAEPLAHFPAHDTDQVSTQTIASAPTLPKHHQISA